jgi:multiple antibiotic resistance protein
MSFEFAITVFAAIFAIVNPIGNIPVFVAITQDYTPEQKRRVIRKACIVAASVLLAFGIFGNYIFAIYGITIPAFKIAGGLLLFSIAFNMTRGSAVGKSKMTGEEHEEAMEKEEVGVVPLGIPLFAGPGAITTVMIYIAFATTSNDVVFDLSAIFISIIITILASYILLRYAEPIFSRMGKSGAGAFTRIMGLLLAAIAIEFIITGTFSAIDSYYHIVP